MRLYGACRALFPEAFPAITAKRVSFDVAQAQGNFSETKALWKQAALVLLGGKFTGDCLRQVRDVKFALF